MGHVNNAVYFAYFEWARTKYWLELMDRREPLALTFIVARAECDFRRELALLDGIDICVRIGEMRNSSLDFVYEIRKRDGKEIAATGKVVIVLFSWEERRKKEIGEDLRRRIEEFQMARR